MSEINDDIKLNHDKLKQKITSAVKNNNKVTFVYDSMIEDYNFLYKKYIDMQIAQEQKERLGSKTFILSAIVLFVIIIINYINYFLIHLIYLLSSN